MPKNTPIRGLSRACLSATLGVTMAITAGLPATAAPAGDPGLIFLRGGPLNSPSQNPRGPNPPQTRSLA